jgi:hypothetical protein
VEAEPEPGFDVPAPPLPPLGPAVLVVWVACDAAGVFEPAVVGTAGEVAGGFGLMLTPYAAHARA